MAPKYQRVAELIRADCLRRNLPMDAYLPTEVDLAACFKVNRLTVRRALKHLENQRIVSPVTGKRRQLLAAAGTAPQTSLVACLGRSSSSPAGTFGNLVFTRMFEQMSRVFHVSNLSLLGIPVDASVTQPPEVIRSPLMQALLVFESLPRSFTLPDVHLPVIAVNAPADGWLQADYKVDFDSFGLAGKAVAKLAALGHRRLVWVEWAGRGVGAFAVERTGYESALKRAGLNAPVSLEIENFPAPDLIKVQAQIRRLLGERPDVDGFITASSDLNPFLMAGLSAAGVAVPDQVSVLALAGQEPHVGGRRVSGYYNDYPAIAEAICEFTRLVIAGMLKNVDRITLSKSRWEQGETVRQRN